METWKWLFSKAVEQIKGAGLPDSAWTFGGGTSLMLRYNHRESKDIDIFLDDVQRLSFLSPRLNDAVEDSVEEHAEQSNFVRLVFDRGEVDFICARQISSCGPTLETICGFDAHVESPIEIIAKKIHYRADEFTPRDVFDLATVYKAERRALLNESGCFSDNFGKLAARVDKLHVTGMLDEYYAEMSILQGGKRIRGQEMDLVQDFFKGLRKKLDQIAEQDQNSRAILIVPDSDGILARKCGIRYDYTKAAWYVHKDRLFEISDKWGGHEDHDSFVDRMRRMRKEADQGLDM